MYIAFFLLLLSGFVQAAVVKETVIRYAQEVSNGEAFASRSDITNGAVKEQWSVNNKVVSAEAYTLAREEAFKQEMANERKREEERKQQDIAAELKKQEFNRLARLDVVKKEISVTIKHIEAGLVKIKNKMLEPYLFFEQGSFATSDQLKSIELELLPRAKDLIALSQTTEDELQVMLHNLTFIPDRLDTLFQSTVKHAINVCDDTKLLKELLEVVNC
jgi:hypothetical protein